MKTLVLGAGVSGKAAAGLAGRLGHHVIGFDHDPGAADAARRSGFDFRGGKWDLRLLEDIDLVVTSPGIPAHAAMIQDAIESGVPLWSELEFSSRYVSAPVLAVTGTNGKTSTVSAATAMLEASGAKVCAAGNIGTALSDVAQDPWDVIVVEASSFQLRFTETFHPSGSAVLNVTPDHLDWHGTYESYRRAKSRIGSNQNRDDVLVYGDDDDGAREIASSAPARTVPVSGVRRPNGGVGAEDGIVHLGGFELPAPSLGPDFISDLVTAAVLALHGGATEAGIRHGFGEFRPGPHRRTSLGTWGDVTWVDDSKATNPHAAVAAAAAYRSVVLIAGGRNKGLDLSPMGAMASVRAVITLGESADEIGALFDRSIVTRVESMHDAVVAADQLAVAGDTVLLAPGCASFDMFESYAERGEAFQRLVARQKAGGDGH